MATKNRKKKKSLKSTMASKANRHELYELAVQCSESEIEFIDDTFQKIRGKKATLLREDFCGTANVCCEWINRRKHNHAIGVDIDREVLDWGIKHRLSQLSKEAYSRIALFQGNVLDTPTEQPDIISAMNFSYWLFKERSQLKRYFETARKNLGKGGILFMDAYGGYDAFKEVEEEREVEAGNFTYFWEQEKYDPISGQLICHIHFGFPDGSMLKRAFTYDWRLWTLPEIRELLDEAGFSKVTIYWQGWDKDGEPDGHFKPVKPGNADADAGWIAYITAEK